MEIKIGQVNMNKYITIVMYHYVRKIKNGIYPNIKGLEVEDFEGQVKYLIKNYNVIKNEELIESIYTGQELPSRPVLLTFDDGYNDHYENVLPILKKYKIQGSFYVPVLTTERKSLLDVNKIHYVLALENDISKLLIKFKKYFDLEKNKFELKNFNEYFSEYARMSEFDSAEVIFFKRMLQHVLPLELRASILDKIFKEVVKEEEESFCKKIYMGKNEVVSLVKEGMHVGCHGFGHLWWNKIPENELYDEISRSTDFLKSLGCDRNFLTACYPYGSVCARAIDYLKSFNYKLAFTTETDLYDGSCQKRFNVPRLDTNHIPKSEIEKKSIWYDKV